MASFNGRYNNGGFSEKGHDVRPGKTERFRSPKSELSQSENMSACDELSTAFQGVRRNLSYKITPQLDYLHFHIHRLVSITNN